MTDGRALYVVAGSGPFDALGSIEKIDVKTGRSAVLPARLDLRRYHAASVQGREIFVFGGENREGIVTGVEAVHLDTGIVRSVGKMPTPRRMVSAVTVEDLIFTFGGSGPGEADYLPRHAALEVFDSAKNKWLRGPAPPDSKECPAVFDGRRIYLLGGYNGGGRALSSSHCLDLSAGQWEELPGVPFTLSAYSAVSIGGVIVCFGDYEKLGRVAAYLVADKKWLLLDVAFTPRRHSSACVVGDRVFVAGGVTRTDGPGLSLIEHYSVGELQAAILRAAP